MLQQGQMPETLVPPEPAAGALEGGAEPVVPQVGERAPPLRSRRAGPILSQAPVSSSYPALCQEFLQKIKDPSDSLLGIPVRPLCVALPADTDWGKLPSQDHGRALMTCLLVNLSPGLQLLCSHLSLLSRHRPSHLSLPLVLPTPWLSCRFLSVQLAVPSAPGAKEVTAPSLADSTVP